MNDDFDAMTQDVDFETASEMREYDGATQLQVRQGNELGGEGERYSGVYGEWVERHEVNHRQAPDLRPEEYLYVRELATRMLDAGLNDQESIHSFDKQQLNAHTTKRRGSEARTKNIERGAKVTMWREEVARNEVDEAQQHGAGSNHDASERIQQWRSKSPPVPRDIEVCMCLDISSDLCYIHKPAALEVGSQAKPLERFSHISLGEIIHTF